MMNQLKERLEEHRLLASEYSAQELEARRASLLEQLLLAPYTEAAMRRRSYGEITLSPLLRKAG